MIIFHDPDKKPKRPKNVKKLGKLVRKRVIKEIVDLDALYQDYQDTKEEVERLESLPVKEKLKMWEELCVKPLREHLAEVKRELNAVAKEKGINDLQL